MFKKFLGKLGLSKPPVFPINHPALPDNPADPYSAEGYTLMTRKPDGTREEEQLNFAALLGDALSAQGVATQTDGNGWLYQPDTGYRLLPLFIEPWLDDDGKLHSATTIQIHHPDLFPQGVFEFQYSFGGFDTLTAAVASGFEQWVMQDWRALAEALQPEAGELSRLTLESDEFAVPRVAIFGNLTGMGEITEAGGEHGGCCPCCLLTQSLAGLIPLLETSHENLAIRLFASRDTATGECTADCRINGVRFEAAEPLLKAFAATWRSDEFVFRKQYVIVRRSFQVA
ncbi:Uncharacterised protein [Kingella potus]|uniref:Uncharacterized protein n=1 Tax=Kingella potus TaxID=265175 RepID=A0A377QYH7_9NEIS|nr:DUF6348 family protein [Kingella potus]UOP01650.1 DUF6348 family protein [Kingella potus]STR00052.1 Uncharacterised protein [Kingella potus]